MFEIQRSGDKTSSGEIGLDIRTHVSPKVGQDQVSGGELYEMSINIFSPPSQLCAVRCITEISLIVTLSNQYTHTHINLKEILTKYDNWSTVHLATASAIRVSERTKEIVQISGQPFSLWHICNLENDAYWKGEKLSYFITCFSIIIIWQVLITICCLSCISYCLHKYTLMYMKIKSHTLRTHNIAKSKVAFIWKVFLLFNYKSKKKKYDLHPLIALLIWYLE